MVTSIKIIVPTLNTYLILPKLINSLKIQTWKDWNLLFVDGDSTKKHFNWIKTLCLSDSRLNIMKQDKRSKGIYGAMNQGFKTIKDNELVLFWGSDDWAISPSSFEDIILKVNSFKNKYDLLICRGRYIDFKSKRIIRKSNFFKNKFSMYLDRKMFRKSLFLGMTPPHQATFFTKNAFDKLSSFSETLELAADLDYFLNFSCIDEISIIVINNELVNMSTNGVSSQKNILRLKEVFYSYKKFFGIFFLVPYILRYIRRICMRVFNKK